MQHLKYLSSVFITISFFFLMTPTVSNAQDFESKIDSVLHAKYPPNAPGATFLIAKKGQVVYKKAFGLANLELSLPMHTENVFDIASMTKQFTAIAILMLEERGKLRIENTLDQYLPDFPNGQQITLHHLLTHTAGIKDFTRVKGLNGIAHQNLSPAALIDFFKHEPADFAPGTGHRYSNAGYVVLGAIIEKVSGQSYQDFITTHIFKKLGMNASYYGSHRQIIKNRASGYHDKKGYVHRRPVSYSIPYASGALLSTVQDLFIWQEALKNNRLIGKVTADKAFANYTLVNGTAINYGYGWHIKDLKGLAARTHGGHFFGFKSMGVYLPKEDIYVVALTNCDCNSPTAITSDIAVWAAAEYLQ